MLHHTFTRVMSNLACWWYRLPTKISPGGNWYGSQFINYKNEREKTYGITVASLRCPTIPNLVSIVLPVYNGADYISEAIDSILCQTYKNFELIIINDGSTDETPHILKKYTRQDPRIRVYHQPNRRLPRTLSRGFRLAQGEFLTWISCDNRLKPNFLARLVDCLKRHPHWDMVYANLDFIGADGNYLLNHKEYPCYQTPLGSPHIHFPERTTELNVLANNYVGAAFMYRDRVAHLLGDYSAIRFTAEDYDYWMRVNELLTLHHADLSEPIYEYRFHANSLTGREKELKIRETQEKLLVFDDFRREFNLMPLHWLLEAEGNSGWENKLTEFIKIVQAAGHIILSPQTHISENVSRLWLPIVYLRFASNPSRANVSKSALPPNTLTALIVDHPINLPPQMSNEWDICLKLGSDKPVPRLPLDYQGWYTVDTLKECFTVLDIKTRSHQLRAIETEISATSQYSLLFSIVICIHQQPVQLENAVGSVAGQTIGVKNYEVIIVDTASTEIMAKVVTELRSQYFQTQPDNLRLISCPLEGLSHLRNAGIAAARGEIICLIDDKAVVKEDWLVQLQAVYRSDSEIGVVGEHFEANDEITTIVENWYEFPRGPHWSARRLSLLEIGGFRSRYDGLDYQLMDSGTLNATSLINRLGYKVAIMPQPWTQNRVNEPHNTSPGHLKRVIQAEMGLKYQHQRPRDTLKNLWLYVRLLLQLHRLNKPQRLKIWYFLMAECRLLIKQLGHYRSDTSR